MKNILLLPLASLILWSCNSETITTEEIAKNNEVLEDTNIVEQETIETIETIETQDELADYSKLEQYAIYDTKSKLVENFGKENIKDGSSWFGEGTLELKHSILTNPSNGHVVKFVWDENDSEKLTFIEVYGNVLNKDFEFIGTQKIETKCGLYTGMTIKEMKELNGADFSFNGFGWDFHGLLRPTDGDVISSCNLSLAMDLKFEEGKDEYNDLYGDIELSTADELVLNAPITLDHITLFVD